MLDIYVFFSSRRRHTRWNCDWSSDVCSSDLASWTSPVLPCQPYSGFGSDNTGMNLKLSCSRCHFSGKSEYRSAGDLAPQYSVMERFNPILKACSTMPLMAPKPHTPDMKIIGLSSSSRREKLP